jgi:uncharacterized GH25 family protein
MAHDFWAGLEKANPGETAAVFVGFGHHFPVPDEIKDEVFTERFDPAKLIGADGEVSLSEGANAYSFVTTDTLSAGSYFVLTSSQIGFASRTPSGFVRKSKADEPTAATCSYGGNFGKNIFTVDPAGDDSWIKNPVGQKLEIVPQINPATVKVGEKFPVIIYFDGKPLPRANVGAFFAGFTEGNEALAFSAPTDKDGQVNIIPLRAGTWIAKVSKTDTYSDPNVCDRESYSASLAFTIKK